VAVCLSIVSVLSWVVTCLQYSPVFCTVKPSGWHAYQKPGLDYPVGIYDTFLYDS